LVEDNVILANNVPLGGHAHIEENVIIGGNSAVQQFTRVGKSSMIGGMAQLAVGFMGTDNFSSVKCIADFYNVENKGTIAHSIPASEHSAVTSWTKKQEFNMVKSFIQKNKGRPIMACVADSYDYYNFVSVVTTYNETGIRELIEDVDYPIFVIRPDSGNPAEIVPNTLDIMEENDIGYTTNKKGFKVFDKYRIIWGDGITSENMKIMLEILKERGYSSENIAFGMGGGLMQGNGQLSNNRDTQAWAIKCSNITLKDGTEVDVFKDPITAPDKKSKKGKVTTYYNPTAKKYFVDQIGIDFDNGSYDVLETVYENGSMIKEYTFDEVRENSEGV
jgi:nicotinamide phosphoribosyltransferase